MTMPSNPNCIDCAKTFLHRCLDGKQGIPVKQVIHAADQQGVSCCALRRAKRALRVKAVKIGDTWYWSMPNNPKGD